MYQSLDGAPATSLLNFHVNPISDVLEPTPARHLMLKMLQRILVMTEGPVSHIECFDCRMPSFVGSAFKPVLQINKEITKVRGLDCESCTRLSEGN